MTAKEFARLQKQSKISDVEFARQLQVNRTTIWRWRTGRKPIGRAEQIAIRSLLEQAAKMPHTPEP